MSESINFQRRRFLGAAALFAAVEFPQIGLAKAPSAELKHSAGFGPLKQIDGRRPERRLCRGRPADGPAVILLHGWPYDIHSYADVAPLLAGAGYRVIVPYLRGYGTTRFLSERHGPQRPAGGAGDRRRSRSWTR